MADMPTTATFQLHLGLEVASGKLTAGCTGIRCETSKPMTLECPCEHEGPHTGPCTRPADRAVLLPRLPRR